MEEMLKLLHTPFEFPRAAFEAANMQVPPGLCGGSPYHSRLHRTHEHHLRGRPGQDINYPYPVPRPTRALSPALTTVPSLLPRKKNMALNDSPTTAMP